MDISALLQMLQGGGGPSLQGSSGGIAAPLALTDTSVVDLTPATLIQQVPPTLRTQELPLLPMLTK